MFEHMRQPLLSRRKFLLRILWCVILSLGLCAATLLVGTIMFKTTEHLSPIDAFLNAVLVMTGLGLVNNVMTFSGKIWTSFYAIFSAIVFFSMLAILFSPVLHRLLHYFHLDIENKQKSD